MDSGIPQKHFIHTQAPHFTTIFFFYAYGNTPPTDLLQYIPQDASRADVLSLGCSDLRDMLYSILLHGRRGVGCGPVPRQLSFVLNDWEPAIHARNLMLLQMILDSRSLLETASAATDGIARGMDVLDLGGGAGESSEESKGPGKNKKNAPKKAPAKASPPGVSFAQRIGVIFSTMYNMFVDAEMLEMIYDVAGRLAASATSPEKWASTELGRLVRFADDRSRNRVRKILSLYTDGSMQEKEVFHRIRQERTKFLTTYMPTTGRIDVISRAMGLASIAQGGSMEANAKMRRHYLREGILDPFPLLLEGVPAKRPGPFKKVNPLLLVTERKGAASSLHYGAFPLDAFHTDVSWWKLQPDDLQDEFGKLAPRVTQYQEAHSHSGLGGATLTNEVRQNVWFCTALEELAQMCGAFLAATPTVATPPPAGWASAPPSAGASHVTITAQVGDSLNFCDALLNYPTSPRSAAEGAPSSTFGASEAGFGPLSFQQGSLHPLHLRADEFGYPPKFDVISTSNLAEHLGIVNLLVAAAPLLKALPHATLLTSLMASLVNQHRYRDMASFQEKLLCMSPQAAGILLGVIPVSSLSSVVGHVDTMSLLCGSMGSTFSRAAGLPASAPTQSRLVWKRPAEASATATPSTGPAADLVDISLSDFVNLILPIYKAMSPMAGPLGVSREELVSMLTMPNHYTSVSFIRLVALASRRLRLSSAHFRAVLEALMYDSGMMLATNLRQEQMVLFHVLDLAPIRPSDIGSGPIPVDARRLVLLVPKSGLSLLREFKIPRVHLSVTGATQEIEFDNFFTCVHMVYVRVRRGGSGGDGGSLGEEGWRSLNGHLSVRDAREDDPEAELMVSSLVPTFGLMSAVPSLTEVRLRPCESVEFSNLPNDIKNRLGEGADKTFYKAGLADADRVAVLTPGKAAGLSGRGAGSPPPLVCPRIAVAGMPDQDLSPPAIQSKRGNSPEPTVLHRSLHGGSTIDRSIELIQQAVSGRGPRLAYRLSLVMANDHARESLAAAGGVPEVVKTRDPCLVVVQLVEGIRHATRLPFPAAKASTMTIQISRRQGFVRLIIPLLRGALQEPFSLTAYDTDGSGGPGVLPSTVFWPPCAPLSSLPRLDFKAEWAHNKVMGPFSFSQAETLRRDEDVAGNTSGQDAAFLGLKESILAIASMASKHHERDLPVWPHPWVCIAENHSCPDDPAIWVWVNEILLDSSNEALLLDCCVLPVDRLGDAVCSQLRASVEIQRGANILFTKAYPGELDLWAKLLPVAVERARQTYAHTADCIYANLSDTPLTLCSCGKGKDLPPSFMRSIQSANESGAGVLHPLVYRAAISPLYAPPDTSAFVENVATVGAAVSASQCAKCGKGGKTLQCTRCRKISYCSKECQVSHWKTHKSTCL